MTSKDKSVATREYNSILLDFLFSLIILSFNLTFQNNYRSYPPQDTIHSRYWEKSFHKKKFSAVFFFLKTTIKEMPSCVFWSSQHLAIIEKKNVFVVFVKTTTEEKYIKKYLRGKMNKYYFCECAAVEKNIKSCTSLFDFISHAIIKT